MKKREFYGPNYITVEPSACKAPISKHTKPHLPVKPSCLLTCCLLLGLSWTVHLLNSVKYSYDFTPPSSFLCNPQLQYRNVACAEISKQIFLLYIVIWNSLNTIPLLQEKTHCISDSTERQCDSITMIIIYRVHFIFLSLTRSQNHKLVY